VSGQRDAEEYARAVNDMRMQFFGLGPGQPGRPYSISIIRHSTVSSQDAGTVIRRFRSSLS
jgi:hypothetical protein